MLRRTFRIVCLAAVVASGFLAAAGDAAAQTPSFGKNKVQYRTFDWRYIQTTHFDVYFDKGDEGLAAFTAAAAESAYASVSEHFRYRITDRIPFVVYNSHNEFQQTNVISSYLEEGIGGVTELFKNRVVVPFEGDYGKFRHVIHHELVHAVINDMFYGGSIQSIISNNITLQLPLWFNEGLAEYEALGWDTNSDMFMRDATMHTYLPPIPQLGGYFAYRGGQSVWNYIGNKYGRDKIGEILNRIRGARNLDAGFVGAIGLTVEELSERWTKEQKVLYWPDIAKRTDPSDYALQLTDHREENAFYNTSPAISPSGDRIAFISDRSEYFSVYLMSSEDGSIIRKMVTGQRTADFEELHLLTPGMSWSPDSRYLALAVKSGEQDAIMLLDEDGDEEEKLEFGLDGIFSVDWGQGAAANKLAFVGVDSGRSDIYVYDIAAKILTNVTNDPFSDSDPAWGADGRSIFFCSDRRAMVDGVVPDTFRMRDFPYGENDVYRVDPSTRAVERITDLPGSSETSPAAAPDGRHLLFISDMNGINNIYVKDLQTGDVRPITNSVSGVYQLSLSRNGEKLAFSSLHNAGFDVFLIRAPIDQRLGVAELEKTEYFKASRGLVVRETPAQPDTIAVGEGIVLKTETEAAVRPEPDAGVNLRNFVFRREDADSAAARPDSAGFPAPAAGYVDAQGNYRVNRYRLNFSPDIIYGNAGYNTLYGVEGSTVMAFSDMLGDHQIFLIMTLLLDLKNSDYALAYLYLPKRIDYGVQAFHSARALYIYDDALGFETLSRFRNYGLSLFAQYPISRFRRVDFGLSGIVVRRENLDIPSVPVDQSTVIVPSISLVDDNTLWGLIAPANGRRFNISALASPGIFPDGPTFWSLTGDYRLYTRLGPRYTLVFRAAGGGSFGRNPQKFIIGGVEGWITPKYARNQFPVESADDYLFLTTGVPLRGYYYSARTGSKYGVVNMELRFPLFAALAAGPLPLFFQTLNGSLFFDAGSAWTKESDLSLRRRDPVTGAVSSDLLSGMGVGVRAVVLGFLLKMDIAWAYDWQRFSTPLYYFSIGQDI